MSVTILDATPENTNDEDCPACNSGGGFPCVYSTNPPIARDRMHYQRIEAAQRTAARDAQRTARDETTGAV